jgi:hypothetical protein
MISSTIQNSKKILSIMDLEPKKHEFIWLLYSWIMPQTDDFGHFDADARVVKAKILPCSPRPVKDFQKAIEVLEQVGLIIVYGDGPFMEIVGFLDHQTLRKDRAHISQFPERTDVNTRKHDGLPVTPAGLPVTPVSEVKLSEEKRSKDTIEQEFDRFWIIYPRKKSKIDAFKAWNDIKPKPTEEFTSMVIAKLLILKRSDEWSKEEGQFIPYPASWLRAGGWDDEVEPETDRDLSQY